MKLAKTEEFPNNNTTSDIDLPEGWVWSTVGKCFFEIKNGTTTVQNEDSQGIPVSRIESIQEGHFDFNRVQHIKDAPAEIIDAYRYKTGDIALSHINSYEHVGKTALYEGVPEVFIHGMNLLRLRFGHEYLLPKYIYLFMQTYFFRQQVRDRVLHAVNQVSINQRNLSKVPIAIAPLYEQKRIVAKVDELLSGVNMVRERLAKVPAILKHFRQAVFAVACSGRLTADWRNTQNDSEQVGDIQEALSDEIPEGWIRNKLVQVAKINMGQSPPGRSYNKRGEGFPFFQGKVDFGDRFPTVRVWCTEPKKIAQPGDVLISIRAPVGPTNVANQICTIGRGLAAISPKDGIPTEFILFVLRLKEPELALSGTGSTFTAINRKDLEQIDINVPPLAEQYEIVRRVEALFKLADTIEKRVAMATARAEKLTQSILAKAFRGELVPTEAELARRENCSYEPASDLLARIKSQRESKGPTEKARRNRNRPKTNAMKMQH